jgi:hypothetical protein
MRPSLRAGLHYFAIVFGVGFVLGMIRVPFLVPRLGERWSELIEMPFMGAAIFFAAGHVLTRHPSVRTPRHSLETGAAALVLLLFAELALAVILSGRNLAEYIASRDPVSGTVYLGMLILFALMPRLRLRSPS